MVFGLSIVYTRTIELATLSLSQIITMVVMELWSDIMQVEVEQGEDFILFWFQFYFVAHIVFSLKFELAIILNI